MSIFAENLVDLDLQVTDKEQVIRKLASLVVAAGRGSDIDQIVADVLARDEMGTPQVEGGAIPHARTAGVNTAAGAGGPVGADSVPVGDTRAFSVPATGSIPHAFRPLRVHARDPWLRQGRRQHPGH